MCVENVLHLHQHSNADVTITNEHSNADVTITNEHSNADVTITTGNGKQQSSRTQKTKEKCTLQRVIIE